MMGREEPESPEVKYGLDSISFHTYTCICINRIRTLISLELSNHTNLPGYTGL